MTGAVTDHDGHEGCGQRLPHAPHIAYLDCFSGIAGDMLLAALLDAGLPLATLNEQLALLPISGYQLLTARTQESGIAALRLTVRETAATDSDQPHHQPHRSWLEIDAMLAASRLADPTKSKARRIFAALATAEGKVHGRPREEIHFHEVGAVDAVVDIVGAVIGLAHLGIERLVCSPLPMPSGWVSCAHGSLPLPAPAVLELLAGAPTYGVELAQELVTPTGAAIVKGLAADFGPMPPMTIEKTGYGAGSRPRADGRPNLLRLVLGQSHLPAEAQSVEVIETHLDDWAGEGFPYLCEQLFARQALDVALVPILMKKGRPGFLLRVLADPAHALALKQCILSETTAIGLRCHREERWTLPRRAGTVSTEWGEIAVKKVVTPAGPVLYPEYESCREAAIRCRVPLARIHAAVAALPLERFRARNDGNADG